MQISIISTCPFSVKVWAWIALMFFLSVSAAAHSNKKMLHIAIANPEVMNPSDPGLYYEQLLVLALEKTRNTDGDFVITHNPSAEGTGRVRAMLMSNSGIDVIWSSVNDERKREMFAVPFNLLRGLNDYRILLIRNDEQDKFNHVKNLNGLRKMTAGSGMHWLDTKIMRANDIPVISVTAYPSLFKMLAAHRFDFIACGLHEVDYVVASFGGLGLALESNLILNYSKPTAYSFFVHKENTQLADRIQRGLALAEADGSFEKMFNDFPGFKQRFSDIKNTKRLSITLQNDINTN